MSFSIKSGTRNSKMKRKLEPEVVFRVILAKKQISGFLRPGISVIHDDEIGRSIGRPTTLWAAAVDRKPNCCTPVNRLQSR